MTGPHLEEEPAEQRRFARYLQTLETVAEEDESDLVAAVLRDEDTTMADSAVGRHLDRRAADLLTDPEFVSWARTVTAVITDRDFLTRRLCEWTLIRTIVLGKPWAAEELTTASDWFQRMAATMQIVTSPEALRLLIERGHTRLGPPTGLQRRRGARAAVRERRPNSPPARSGRRNARTSRPDRGSGEELDDSTSTSRRCARWWGLAGT